LWVAILSRPYTWLSRYLEYHIDHREVSLLAIYLLMHSNSISIS